MHDSVHTMSRRCWRLLPEKLCSYGLSKSPADLVSQRVLYVLCVSVLVTNPRWLIVLR